MLKADGKGDTFRVEKVCTFQGTLVIQKYIYKYEQVHHH